MAESPVPPAAESPPLLSGLLWGAVWHLLALVATFALVGIVGLGLLDASYGSASPPSRGPPTSPSRSPSS